MARSSILLAVLTALVLAPAHASAQNADPFRWSRPDPEGQTVRNRARPELDPLGVRVGSFRFFPSLELGVDYDDNVFRSAGNRKGDLAVIAHPRFRLQSEFANHSIVAEADVSTRRHFTHTSESREEFGLRAAGRLDLTRDSNVTASARVRRSHESRVSPDSGGVDAPVRFHIGEVRLGGETRLGRYLISGDVGVTGFDYDDARQRGTGNVINHDDRDRTVYRAGGRAGYGLSEGLELYGAAEVNTSDYADAQDDGGFGRDSSGVDLRIGASADVTGATRVEGYVGYRGQYYANDGAARLGDESVDALIIGGTIVSNISTLTTAHARLDRGVFESTLAGSPGGVATRAGIGVDHEVLRNLLLYGDVGGRIFAFEGVDRDDYGVSLRLGAEYLMNRNLTLEASVEHERNESTGRAQV